MPYPVYIPLFPSCLKSTVLCWSFSFKSLFRLCIGWMSDFVMCFRHENVLPSALRALLLFEYQDERLATAFRFISLGGMGGNVGRAGAPQDGFLVTYSTCY
jgi:hypothetical protein